MRVHVVGHACPQPAALRHRGANPRTTWDCCTPASDPFYGLNPTAPTLTHGCLASFFFFFHLIISFISLLLLLQKRLQCLINFIKFFNHTYSLKIFKRQNYFDKFNNLLRIEFIEI